MKKQTAADTETTAAPRKPNHTAASTTGRTKRNDAPMYVGRSIAKRTTNTATKRPPTMAARRARGSRIPGESLVT